MAERRPTSLPPAVLGGGDARTMDNAVSSTRSRSLSARSGRADLYASLYDALLFPGWQGVVHGRPVYRYGRLLGASQWFEREALDRLKLANLRSLLLHAAANVPYYREVFRSLRFDARAVTSLSDLEALPVLTRDTIRERYDDLIDPGHRGRTIQKQTSESTGSPVRFEYCNDSESWRQAVRLRAYRWAGYRQGLPTIHYWGTGTRVARGLRVDLDRALRREVYVDAALQDEDAMRRTAERIARMKPHAIVAYTQALACFARWVLDRGARDWGDIVVIGGAEPMLSRDRAVLERVFGPKVYETYGSRETMLIASECERRAGLHVAEENVIVEIARDGRVAPPGEAGDVVVTDLHNYGMPFIRYVNGDVACFSRSVRCGCGRELQRLARVDGRVADTMRTKTGAPVPGMVFISLLNAHEAEIREFQAVQKASGAVELRVVPGRNWSESAFAPTAQRLTSYFGGLPFDVVLVDAIAADASGKRRHVIVERN
jgi:phenylacetate-CoA ligase